METPEYIFEEAAKVAHETISPELQKKFSVNDILEILLIEDEFFDTLPVTEEQIVNETAIEVDDDEMMKYIIEHVAEKKIIITLEELDEILDGEFAYLEQKGLIDGEE